MAILTLIIEHNRVTVSAENELNLSVRNDTEEDVIFERDISPVTGFYDGIYLTFRQGERAEDLQPDLSHIIVEIEGIEGWSCNFSKVKESPIDNENPYWCLRPVNGMRIKPDTKFDIHLKNIQCNSIIGTTPVKIAQQSMGDMNKENLSITKCSKAVVDQFKIQSLDYNIGDMVIFEWSLHDTDSYSNVYLNGILQTGSSCKQPIHNRSYDITIENGSSYVVKSTLRPTFVFFEFFQIVGGDGANKTLTVEWRTRNLMDCYLLYQDKKEAVDIKGGSKTIKIQDEGQILEIQLEMTEGETGVRLPMRKCGYQFPEVTVFQAYNTTELLPVNTIKQMKIIPMSIQPYREPPEPPDPPEPTPTPPVDLNIHIEWDSQNSIRCELSGVPQVKGTKGSINVSLKSVPRGPLNAIDQYGFVRGKMNEKG